VARWWNSRKPLARAVGEITGRGVMAADAAGQRGSAEFGILGPLEVSRAGSVLPLGGPRQRAVLALLLLEANRVVSMDRLAEEVWDGHPPDGWATTLQTYVFHLRQALEPDRARGAVADVLVTRDRGYLLRVDHAHLDAAQFQDAFTAGRAALDAGRFTEAAGTLREALGLWRSGVLADLADYAFTRPEAARLEELRLAALEARIDADLALGRHDELTAELEQLAAEHPLRERLHGQLMLALYRSGRQAEALAAYRRVRDLLAEELGIDPGEPLQRLHASVLAHDPTLDWRTASQAPADGHRSGTGAPIASPAPRPSGAPPVAGSREVAWVRQHARRVLAIGSALAVAAVACIVAVARPWEGGPAGLPANSVGLIDSSGGRVGSPVSVGSPEGLAYGDGSVWAADSTEGRLSRINPATYAVIQQIPVGSAPTAVTVTGQDVWVTNGGDGTVSRINAAANTVVQQIPVGNVPVAIANGRSGVWVANAGDDTVSRIDPATGTVTKTVQAGGRPDGIAVGPHAVWVANSEDGTISQIDPVTGDVNGPISVGSGPAGIAVTPTAVWVANALDHTVSKIDPAADRVTDVIGVGDGPSAIVAATDGVWVSNEFDATLNRIDPQANRVDRAVSLGGSPRGMAVTGSGVWVAARAFAAASHRGGTLTAVGKWLPETDPTQAYDPASTSSLGTVYDGLVALRRAGGAAGLTLVPDLARTLPRPTDGGTTYTFTLRRGIRYSNGAPVRASDFRRGFERQLNLGIDPGYYEGILGAQACKLHLRRCDLSPGIVVNDAARTVTFHLRQADPDFLYKLATLFAVPAAPGAPPHRVVNGPPFLPGTGPYMISQYRPNVSFTLVRNPYFRQWSYAAQPAGYPSVIRFQRVASPAEQQSAVIAGRADLTNIGPGDQSLATRYPTRVHPALTLATIYLFLNTRQPPFTSIKARQAVNYAIDRARMLQLFHLAPGQGVTACQIFPAGFPAHQSYCPYTTGPKDGGWHGPDVEKARRLTKDSGMTNTPVTLWFFKDLGDRTVGSYLLHLLKDLGYRAKLHIVSLEQMFTTINNSRNKVQIGLVAWGADFPTASTFFLPILSCRSLTMDPSNSANYAKFCDPHVDRLASEAQARQLTDPGAARRLWARVDRIITDQAPWAPVINEASTVFVSTRVGNYQESAQYGPLLSQMWVR
jgi:YVTN family beta-propeller protein